MRTQIGFAVGLMIASCLFGQGRGGGSGAVSAPRAGGGVAAPARSFAAPAAPRPSGGTQIGIPYSIPSLTYGPFPPSQGPPNGGSSFRRGAGMERPAGRIVNRGSSFVAAYPIYVGGDYGSSYGGGYYDAAYQAQQAPQQQQQPNVMIFYPPQPAPVIINQYPGEGQYASAQPGYPPAVQSQTSEPPSTSEAAHYLVAFKDHTIYSAVAYWVDGDTLHYFTNGNTHNQVSVSLIDRELTQRLNRESGVDVKLPAAR